ncbi:MAG: efflux transporter outer membrane subunit [Sphingopyxis sp.]|nr:efflux transporter outer membrane subunit [Sphingopyxis sp.]
MSACAAGNDIRPMLAPHDIATLQPGAMIAAAARAAQAIDRDCWWQPYGDPQLDMLVSAVGEGVPSIEAVLARLAQASAELDAVRSDRLPRVTGSASASGAYFPDHATWPEPYAGGPGSEGALRADVRYRLDFWGKRRQAALAANARLSGTGEEVRDAILLLRTALVEAYVRLDADYRLRDLAEAALERHRDIAGLLVQRERAGLATDIDAVEEREAVTNARAEIARLDGEIARNRYRIAALLGRDPAFAEGLERPAITSIADPAPMSAIPAELLGYRPDIAAARAGVEAAAHDIGVARAAFYPDIDLTAFAGLQSLGLGHLLRVGSASAGIGPALSLPIFEGGRLRAELRGRTADYDAAVSRYNMALATALQQVADAVAALNAERARRAEADAAVAHWQRIVDLHRLRETRGLSSAANRLGAETALLRSERAVIESAARKAIGQTALVRALGGGAPPSFSPFSQQGR